MVEIDEWGVAPSFRRRFSSQRTQWIKTLNEMLLSSIFIVFSSSQRTQWIEKLNEMLLSSIFICFSSSQRTQWIERLNEMLMSSIFIFLVFFFFL